MTTVEERWDPGRARGAAGAVRAAPAVCGGDRPVGRRARRPRAGGVRQGPGEAPAEIRDLGPYLRRMVVNLATDERRRFGRAATFAPKIATDGAHRLVSE